jgi:hypothetical protein
MTYGRYGAEDKGAGVNEPSKAGCRWGKGKQAGTQRARRTVAAAKSPR